MKFVDEAVIKIEAGHGGHGCLSFRREKCVPFGGPDGGDGGDGASIFLLASPDLNTLIDFRYKRQYKAENGQCGMGANCTGKQGQDMYIQVPVGTIAVDVDTGELLADLQHPGQTVLLAQGGAHGLGNTRFKSSTNRAPRRTTNGAPGEFRQLRLELRLLADVGLLGMPNAGKSSLIRAMSAARPKVADYPFTTLRPNLGVVRVGIHQSFVVADIPGLIEGAASGAGLGHRFLKHLSRTRLLLHIIDLAPTDNSDPVLTAQAIIRELGEYHTDLQNKPRWLVLNKIDLFTDPDECQQHTQDIVNRLQWTGPVFAVSAIRKEGIQALSYAIMQYLQDHPKDAQSGARLESTS